MLRLRLNWETKAFLECFIWNSYLLWFIWNKYFVHFHSQAPHTPHHSFVYAILAIITSQVARCVLWLGASTNANIVLACTTLSSIQYDIAYCIHPVACSAVIHYCSTKPGRDIWILESDLEWGQIEIYGHENGRQTLEFTRFPLGGAVSVIFWDRKSLHLWSES